MPDTPPPAPHRPLAAVQTDLRNRVAAITSHWMDTDQLAAAAVPLAETAAELDAHTSAALSPLTRADVRALAAMDQAALDGTRVRRLLDDGNVAEGVARHFTVDERGAFPGDGDDVRACLFRVTGTGLGSEYFWPVSELVAEWWDRTFVIGG